MPVRAPIRSFELANPLYKNASVSFYTVASGVKTSTLATLYAGVTGTQQLGNPQKLNSRGRMKQPVYIEESVIGTVSGISVPGGDTAIISPYPTFRVNSTTGNLEYSYDGGVTWNIAGSIYANAASLVMVNIIATIALLKALAAPVAPIVYLVAGFAAFGDGGGGLYWWNSADSTADNGGTVIALNAGGVGRFNKFTF